MIVLNSDTLKPERQKLLKARKAQEAWLKVALGKEVRNVQMLAEQKRQQVEEDARREERLRQQEQHAKGMNERKKRILDLREEAAKAKAALKAFTTEEKRAKGTSLVQANNYNLELIQQEKKKLWAERNSTQIHAQTIYHSIKSEVERQKVASIFDVRAIEERANALLENAFQPSGFTDT